MTNLLDDGKAVHDDDVSFVQSVECDFAVAFQCPWSTYWAQDLLSVHWREREQLGLQRQI